MDKQTPRSRIVLAGNPNAGKTTLFNSLTGMRMQTGNFAGTTVSKKSGTCLLQERSVELIDLPGMYSLDAASEEERVAGEVLMGTNSAFPRPDVVLAVMDATNLERNLYLFSHITECDLPMVVALTMVDRAHEEGLDVDASALEKALGCRVIPVNVEKKLGVDDLKAALSDVYTWGVAEFPRPHKPSEDVRCGVGCSGCPFHGRFTWSEQIVSQVIKTRHAAPGRLTDSLDEILTHSVLGLMAFLVVMFFVFYAIFSLATIPMDLIEVGFETLGDLVARWLPEGDLQSLIRHGVIGGVGGVVVFLPQICLLFLLLALLDDSGYLARAAFVMDRVMRKVGLPGTAFVPMISGHACAIPAIMATRVISSPRDRLVTILVLPLTSCSARIPVYVLMVTLLFPHNPAYAASALVGAYALGILSALAAAWGLKKTILPGESEALLLEMPAYKLPNLKNALLHTWEKALIFLKQAGTVILLISIGLWVLSTYPKTEVSPEVASEIAEKIQLEHSMAGRIGKAMEPVIRPLGFDWQIGIGILSSFAAREAIISGLSVVYGIGESGAEDSELLVENLRQATRTDGSPVFTVATCLSLLVFYVLAMQCLPTQAVTKAETGSWKWAGFQLLYMSVLAYVASLVVYQGLQLFGVS
ncbi:ferrous iron transport protein B [Kiritimatiellaeota bacterium B1221]|nr:ferrous iron transport protein B [Kiritimatiellaeota bacterium B1221]